MEKLTLFYDPLNGEIVFKRVNCIIINRSYQGRIQRQIEGIVGPITKILIYEGAKKAVIPVFKYLYRNLSNETEKLNFLLKTFQHFGYGQFEVIKREKQWLRIRVRNCYNADGYKNARKPCCYAMAGTLAGGIQALFDREIYCAEQTCAGQGAPFCEFELFPRASIMGETKVTETRYTIPDMKRFKRYEVLYNNKKGELIFEKTRSVAVVREQSARYLREFEGLIGPSARPLIYDVSKKAAIEAISNIKRTVIRIISLFSKKRVTLELLKQLPRRGYGRPILIEFNEDIPFVRIKVKNCYAAIGFPITAEPVCYTLAGIFSGGAEMIFNREMSCVERTCATMGYKFCEFEIRPKSETTKEAFLKYPPKINKL